MEHLSNDTLLRKMDRIGDKLADMEMMNGYKCFYNNKEHYCLAGNSYQAQLQAIEHFKPSKATKHMVHVHLCEKDGKEVTHTATQ